MSAIIQLNDVTFRYPEGKRNAIEHFSVNIESGSFVAVLGHNGSGKSTLAKLMNGILLPNEGKVFVKGMDTADEDRLLDIRRTAGMIFQNPDNQIVASVVEDDVAFGPENLGVPSEEIRRRVDEALELVDMGKFATHAPHLLSGGQKQRIAIAGVLAMQPEVLILDESTSMLDPSGRQDVLDIIAKLRRERNVTVILITHHMCECVDADRLLVMSQGKLMLDDTPEAVFAQVERMRSLGLDVPATAEILWRLRGEGWDFPGTPLSVDACADAIAAQCR